MQSRSKPRLRLALAALLLLGSLLLLALVAGDGGSGAESPGVVAAGADPDPALTPSEMLASAPRYRVETTSLGRGGTLGAALERLSVPPELRPTVLQSAANRLDLRRLPADTGLAGSFDAGGALRQVALRTEPDRYLRLVIASDPAAEPLREEMIELPVETVTEVAEGVVESSVAQALGVERHGTYLTAEFADVFQWDVDLLVEPRSGDRVRVVYETRSLGEVPDDVPPFGAAASRPGQELPPGRILAARYLGTTVRATALWVEHDEGGGDYYDLEGKPLRKAFLKSPLNYRRISSGFTHARRNPVTRKVVPHHGVDFAAAPGTPVAATADGRVISAGWSGALGRAVKIRHGSEYVTVYGHLRGFARGIRSGVQVKQNQVIGYVGSSGRATGPHLHYTMLRSGQAINPLRFENPPVEPLPDHLRPRLATARSRWAPLLDLDLPDELEVAERDTPPGQG